MDKISLQNYQVEDFISDESFINYHLQSNKNDRLFWEEWLADHPDKQDLVKEAKEMLETLSLTISEKTLLSTRTVYNIIYEAINRLRESMTILL